MLNPSMPQNLPTASTPSSSSSAHPALGNGAGAQASASSFSKVLASEMHGKRDERTAGMPPTARPGAAADTLSTTVTHKSAADIARENMAPGAEPEAAVSGAAPARQSARAGSAAGTAAEDTKGAARPEGPEEKGNPDPLAEILAGLAVAQPAGVHPHMPADAQPADTRTGAEDSGSAASAPRAARHAVGEGTSHADVFQLAGGRYANLGKTGTAASAGGFPATAPTAQAAQAKGKQDVLLDTEKDSKADKTDRTDAGRPDAAWRNDFKLSLQTPGVAVESEKQGKAATDAEFPSLLQSTPTAPQMNFMTQPAERQFTMANAGAAAPVPVMQDLQTPVGDSGWDDALGQKVMWMVSSQEQVAELSLNPPDLGPLQVTLSISNDQATATFVSQHADVRQALEAALPRLKEMMAESGIDLGGATVSSGSEGSQQQGFERQNRSGSHYSSGESSIGSERGEGVTSGYMGRKNRLVDTFA